MMRPLPLIALSLALASLAACGGGAEQTAPTAGAAAPSGPRLTLKPQTIPDWRAVPAEIATVNQAQALARIPGVLTSLSVSAGDMVRRGQAIGRIVDTQLAPQAAAYGAQAAAAQAQAAQAQSELARIQFLHDNGVYSRARLDQAEAAAGAATAQVRAARAQQSAVGAVAGQGVVTAPVSGRVLRADVPAGSPVAPGMAIVTVAAGEPIVRLQIPESLARLVHAGSRVVVVQEGGASLTGTVAKLYPAVEAGQVMADVALAGIDGNLIGRRVEARVETGTRTALLVPRRFVTRRYGLDHVTLAGRDGAADVPVQIAPAADPDMVEILSGVGTGDTLIGTGKQ